MSGSIRQLRLGADPQGQWSARSIPLGLGIAVKSPNGSPDGNHPGNAG